MFPNETSFAFKTSVADSPVFFEIATESVSINACVRNCVGWTFGGIQPKSMVMKQMLFFCALMALSSVSFGFSVIAHRGVAQTYPRNGLDNYLCTATRIRTPTHHFIENTLDSMQAAFADGADIVELDIHPTADGKLAVFHDWTLNCRTEATCESGCNCNDHNECVTSEQTWDYLSKLDLGYGYTSDGGKTFPLRGLGVGKMPALKNVLELMEKNPEKEISIDPKDTFHRTVDLFIQAVEPYPPELRRRIHFEFSGFREDDLRRLEIQEAVHQGGGPAKECAKKYLLLGWSGYFPEACRNTSLFIPLHETMGRLNKHFDNYLITDFLWGWPEKFIALANTHGTKVYVSQVDSIEDLEFVRNLKIEGVMTNKIEVVGPAIQKNR